MNLKILLLICICSASEISSLKRIKRNSSEKTKTSRVKQDFVVLQTANENLKDNNDTKEGVTKIDFNFSKNTNVSEKNRSIPRPLAVILKERERKINEGRNPKEVKIDKPNVENFEKLLEDNGNSNKNRKKHKNKHSPHTPQTTNLVGSHQAFGEFSPFAPLEQLMRFGNMMMFKVGLDKSVSKSCNPHSFEIAPSSFTELHPNFYQQFNEPSVDYIFNSVEQPQYKVPVQSKRLIIEHPITNHEPFQLANLMQTALDTLLTNGDTNEEEIELRCPLHHEIKGLQNKETNEDADIIQVCSCRFIKNNKEDNKKQK